MCFNVHVNIINNENFDQRFHDDIQLSNPKIEAVRMHLYEKAQPVVNALFMTLGEGESLHLSPSFDLYLAREVVD